MNRDHQLDAPDNEELKLIEQVADHSELTTLYHKAKDQWDGELVSDVERERRRQDKYDTISFPIRKKFVLLGILIPLPLILAWLITSVILKYVDEDNAPMFVVPMIFTFLAWAALSFAAYRKIYATFYDNALQAGPFVVSLLLMLIASIPMVYILSMELHDEQLVLTAGIVGSILIALSILLAIPLLRIWSTPKIDGNNKFAIICSLIAILLGTSLYLAIN